MMFPWQHYSVRLSPMWMSFSPKAASTAKPL
ncbi:hypothetical protein SKA58_16953 [Sphingomonas sp. SKA58]|nr:hypothetical protein SKA58_16953 [Sphingomonas sp. SKA58]